MAALLSSRPSDLGDMQGGVTPLLQQPAGVNTGVISAKRPRWLPY